MIISTRSGPVLSEAHESKVIRATLGWADPPSQDEGWYTKDELIHGYFYTCDVDEAETAGEQPTLYTKAVDKDNREYLLSLTQTNGMVHVDRWKDVEGSFFAPDEVWETPLFRRWRGEVILRV